MSISTYLENNPLDLTSLDGMTDPDEILKQIKSTFRSHLKGGGYVPPTEGITRPVPEDEIEFNKTFNKARLMKANPFDSNDSTYNDRRFEFIAAEEGYRKKVYDDGLGKRTIGYGFNLDAPENKKIFTTVLGKSEQDFEAVRSGKRNITKAEARLLFEAAVKQAENIVSNKFADVPMRSHQRLALVSLAYNHPNLLGPNLTEAIKNGDIDAAEYEIRHKSNKYRLDGIASRRNREADLFIGPAMVAERARQEAESVPLPVMAQADQAQDNVKG